MTSPSSVDRLRQAIADTLSIDAKGLQAAIGQLVVATSADYPAAGPQDRSLYSAAVRTTVLLADRIPEGQEAQALAQEIARHHGRQAAQAVIGERVGELLGSEVASTRVLEDSRHATLEVLKRKQIGVSDLVLATQSANPQIEFAIGTHEGTAPGGKVQLRLLHVMRKWGNDGHGRPDGSMVQAIYAGVGNYSDFDVRHVRKIAPADVPQLLALSLQQLRERLSGLAAEVEAPDPGSEEREEPVTTVVEYSSVWDEDTLTTQAVLDLRTGEVMDIEPAESDEDLGRLQYEEIRDVSRGVSAVVEARDGRYFLKNMEMLSQFGGKPLMGDRALDRGGDKVRKSGGVALHPVDAKTAAVSLGACGYMQKMYVYRNEVATEATLAQGGVSRAFAQHALDTTASLVGFAENPDGTGLWQVLPMSQEDAQTYPVGAKVELHYRRDRIPSNGELVAVTLGHTEKPLVCATDDSPAPGM